MNTDYSKEHYISDKGLGKDYAILVNHFNNISELWRFIIYVLYSKYQDIEKNDKVDEKNKNKAKAELEIEILCKTLELLEGLYSIIEALTNEENRIQDTIVDFHMDKDTKQKYKNIQKKEDKYFYQLLTYPELTDLSLEEDEKLILKRVYDVNIKMIKNSLKILYDFYENNLTAYNKHKHSKPMIIGLPYEHENIYAITIVMSRNKKNKEIEYTALLHNKIIIKRYLQITDFAITIMKDLLDSRIRCIDSSNFKQPILNLYFDTSNKAKEKIEYINRKVSNQDKRKRTKVSIDFKHDLPEEYIDKTISFYENMPKTMKFGKDNELEELVKGIDSDDYELLQSK